MDIQPAHLDRLAAELPGSVHLPDTAGYAETLGRVFFPDASRRRPACVVSPATTGDVATVMRAANECGLGVTVRGGGLSSNCVADGAVLLDLSRHMNSARQEGDQVVVAGGATVGAMLDALAPAGRIVPVGIAAHAGFGLMSRGGVGYFTRSLGLTIDHLVEVELVLPSGRAVRLSDESGGDDADLWWAVRGCAPPFGVITSATLRTHEAGPVWVDRMVIGLDALPTYFRVAPRVPRHTMMGAVLGYSDLVPGEPIFFVYTTCSSQDATDIAESRLAASEVENASRHRYYRSEMTGRYLSGLPEYTPPGAGGADPAPLSLPEPGDRRGSFYGKAVFVGPTLDESVAEALAKQVRAAPTPFCRIDFQQTGGALADVGDTDTAFWGRGSEWNIPLNAIWDDPADGPACLNWARDTLAVLAGHTTGVYSVEVRPGFAETYAELEAAFGGNLERLRALRAAYDPRGVFSTYPL
ncbi:FAD-binding oxidoreductase [Gordonia rubripertincta]|uniref:FAD-binding oxidoreductase n=1 Tax=Gordonia rubripertincta TaxID=36822 RepID=A0ABT4MRH1_GORRU|nr:FAD-binding oxidoreductase [Gordonia rubripertincta]MCZ4549612.1 FAD-binding oxidoreductase [Gordonia rubripertincta]